MNPLTNVRNISKLNDQDLGSGRFEYHLTWHYQYKDSAYIFIGGLPFDLTEGDILCVFSQYGEIVNLNLVRDKKTGKSKGYGFLCYEDQRSTVLAVDNFNGIKLGGRTIRVDHVEEYRRPKGDEKDESGKYVDKIETGCAPVVQVSDTTEVETLLPVKPKKSKKEKKKHKKKKEKRSHRDSGSDGDQSDEKKNLKRQRGASEASNSDKIRNSWEKFEKNSNVDSADEDRPKWNSRDVGKDYQFSRRVRRASLSSDSDAGVKERSNRRQDGKLSRDQKLASRADERRVSEKLGSSDRDRPDERLRWSVSPF